MSKRLIKLILALYLSMMLLIGGGLFLKYGPLSGQEEYQDKSAAALPLLFVSDGKMRDQVWEAYFPLVNPPSPMGLEQILPEPSQPEPSQPEETDPPETMAEPEPIPPLHTSVEYDESGSPVFIFDGPAVEDSWFDNVLFIGDSRTCSLRDLARSGNADYFCDVGMNVFQVMEKTCEDRNFGSQTLDGVLANKKYERIFVSLGLNEAGYDLSGLMSQYEKLVNHIREKQPEAKIILQGIMSVSRDKAESASYFRPAHLEKINDAIRNLADDESIFYIHVNDIFAGDGGYLLSGLSGDGCHLYGKYSLVWENWIRYAVAQFRMD